MLRTGPLFAPTQFLPSLQVWGGSSEDIAITVFDKQAIPLMDPHNFFHYKWMQYLIWRKVGVDSVPHIHQHCESAPTRPRVLVVFFASFAPFYSQLVERDIVSEITNTTNIYHPKSAYYLF